MVLIFRFGLDGGRGRWWNDEHYGGSSKEVLCADRAPVGLGGSVASEG